MQPVGAIGAIRCFSYRLHAAIPVTQDQVDEFSGLLGRCLERAVALGLDVAVNVSLCACDSTPYLLSGQQRDPDWPFA